MLNAVIRVLSLFLIGVDDVLAILQALSSSPEDLEVLLSSVTYGNVPVTR